MQWRIRSNSVKTVRKFSEKFVSIELIAWRNGVRSDVYVKRYVTAGQEHIAQFLQIFLNIMIRRIPKQQEVPTTN